MQTGSATRSSFERAKKVMPGGVTSNFRYWGDDKTFVLKKGQGGYVFDMDDKKYIDYRLGFGPVILGHAHPAVIDRVTEALSLGNVYAMTHPYEIEAAEKIQKMTGVDRVRFANSGTEATMHAIRMARAATGRNKVLKFEGCYHGFQDYTLWNCYPPLPEAGPRQSSILIPSGAGIPSELSRLLISIPFNDEELLEKKVKENWGDLACIIMEPILGNCGSIMPKKGYLEFVRKLCDEYGVVLILDEVKTGFRLAKGGAQEYFNIKGDLVTYAKCLGNGFPIAAIGGKEEIMGDICETKVPHGGTYCGNVVGTAAACATLDEIEAGALEKADAHGQKIGDLMRNILDQKGIPYILQGPPSMQSLIFTDMEKVEEYRDMRKADYDKYDEVVAKLIEKGVMPDLWGEPWFTSAAHTDQDAEYVAEVFEETIKEVF